jgi:hypothetical protein
MSRSLLHVTRVTSTTADARAGRARDDSTETERHSWTLNGLGDRKLTIPHTERASTIL